MAKKKVEIKEIKEIDVMSLAKVLAFIHGTIGLIIGLLLSMFSFSSHMGFGRGMMFPFFSGGFASVIFLPIFYATMGFLIGLLTGSLYNLIAKRIGGIKLKF